MSRVDKRKPIKTVRFKSLEEMQLFEKHMAKRKIPNFPQFVRESVELYEKEESPLDTLNKEIKSLNKNIVILEKKVDVTTEITRSLLIVYMKFIKMYCKDNDRGFDDESLDNIDRDIVFKVQNGLSWSEEVLHPMGLKRK